MKPIRVLLWCVGLALVLAAAVLAVALNSSFQTWAARKALAAQQDVHGTIGRLSAGFSRVELKETTLESGGAVLTLPALRADLPLLAAGLRERVAVSALIAKGWTLDLSKADPAATAALWQRAGAAPARPEAPAEFSLLSSAHAAEAAPAPAAAAAFRGVLAATRLPVDLSLDGVDLEGEIVLPPTAGQPSSRLHLTLRGGGLRAGAKGQFVVDVTGARPDGGSIELHATLAATMDTPRTFNQVVAAAKAAASGSQFPEGVKLDLDVTIDRSAAGETYSALVSGRGKELAVLKGELSSSASRITGSWRVDLRDSDVSPFLLGRKIPVLAARGEGSFETATALKEIHITGKFTAAAERLEAIQPGLAAVGAVNLVADFDLLQNGASLRVERLHAVVAGAAPIATIRALQPFEFNVSTAELRVADPASDLVSIVLEGVPLAWAQPFLGDITLAGGALRGEFAAGAREGGLALRARSPLTISGLSVSRNQEPLLRQVDLSVDASADYTLRGWQVEVVQLAARHGARTLFQLAAKAGQLAGSDRAIKATGHWSADLAAVTEQPALASSLRLAAGRAEGEFTASIDGTQALDARITLADMAGTQQERLPNLSLGLRADRAPEGRITFTAPLVLEQAGRKSDLQLAGTLTPASSGTVVDAKLTSETIHVPDVQILTVLVPGGGEPEASPSAPSVGPFWAGWSGQVALALKRVIYSADFQVSDVIGTVRVDPAALNLEGLRAAFGPESDMKVSGGVKYDAQARESYSLGLDATLNNFDTGPAFRAIDPAKLPTVEGRVNLATHLVGTGENLAQATERARGDLQVTGRSGVFRALSADVSDKVQRTQSTVAALGGLIGAVTGKKEYVDYAARTQIISDIAKALAEIPFDQLNVTATRDAGLNVSLKDFTLISPEVRLTGGGGISYVDATSLLQQPLNLELHLGARGKLGDLLKRAGLLETRTDTLGYTSFVTPIKVGGSLAHTDTSELLKTLLNSTLLK